MFYRTAESVSPKHPDKLCDQISDAILDAYLAVDPNARVAAETCGGHGVVFVTGEITSTAQDIDIPAIVKRIAGPDVEVHTKIVKQSPEIAQGVDTGGAGDQGIMIGYATDEMELVYNIVLNAQLSAIMDMTFFQLALSAVSVTQEKFFKNSIILLQMAIAFFGRYCRIKEKGVLHDTPFLL